MKKKIVALICCLLTLTGCGHVRENGSFTNDDLSVFLPPVSDERSLKETTEFFKSSLFSSKLSCSSADASPETPTPEFSLSPLSSLTPSSSLKAPTTVKMTFVGDCMLASYKGVAEGTNFAATALKEDPSYFLKNVKSVFQEDDFTVVNLECVLTDNSALRERHKEESTPFWFKGPTRNTDILTVAGVEAVSLANNHTNDYGSAGSLDTVHAVERAGLFWGNDSNVMYLRKEDVTVAVICHGLWGGWQAEEICEIIQNAAENSDYQIVFFHGGKERLRVPEEWKVTACHKMIDAGADLIIGNHPHVLQPYEIYKGVNIVYSLGNFCYGGSRSPDNRTIIYQAILTFSEEGITTEISDIPCYVYTGSTNNWQPAIITDEEEIIRVRDFMWGRRSSPF